MYVFTFTGKPIWHSYSTQIRLRKLLHRLLKLLPFRRSMRSLLSPTP